MNADSNSETAELVLRDGCTMTSIALFDISEPADAQAWIIHNNAGNTRFGLFPVSVEVYEFTWHHMAQHAWPYLSSCGGGIVLMCGSIAVPTAPDLLQAAQVAAKGAVMALTRQLASGGIRARYPGELGEPQPYCNADHSTDSH